MLVTALREIFWLSCLVWGFLFMIAAVGEGIPYTSIYVRDEFWQDAIGGLGLFLAMLGVYLGFSIGKTKKRIASMARGKHPAGPLMTLGNVRDR
jgi:hypothetical protein